MKSSAKISLLSGVLVVAAGIAQSPQLTVEAHKITSTTPLANLQFTPQDHAATPTPALTPAEQAAIKAELVKKFGMIRLTEAPFRLSLSQTHPHAGFYARLCNTTVGFDEPHSFVSMRRPNPIAAPFNWENASWVAAMHEIKPGYAYQFDFELRNLTGGAPGPVQFKVFFCRYQNNQFIPMQQVVVMSYPNNHLVLGYHPTWTGSGAVVIQPALMKGVQSVLITPHKLQ